MKNHRIQNVSIFQPRIDPPCRKGKNHINREELLKINDRIVFFLENILFKSAHHFKRGNGCTILTKNRIAQAEYYDRPIKKRVYRCKICGKIKTRDSNDFAQERE